MYAKAFEKNEEQKLWDIWLTKLPHMNKNNYISFEQYKRKFYQPKVTKSNMTVEEQIKEAERIKSQDQKR
jgi:hypothetical protein